MDDDERKKMRSVMDYWMMKKTPRVYVDSDRMTVANVEKTVENIEE